MLDLIREMISIIIPTYNRGSRVKIAIESALSQTYKDFEIIVVDDGSTDNTREILNPYKDHIRYFYQENRGVASARNKGIRESRGEFIAFLDSDDYWLPEKLEMQADYFKTHPDVSMVYSRHWKKFEQTGEKELRPKNRKLVKGYIYSHVLFSSYIWMGSVMVRRDCLFTVGLFSESDESLIVDKDMFLRIAKKFKIGAIEKPLAVHMFHRVVKDKLITDNFIKFPLAREKQLKEGFENLKGWEKIRYFVSFRLRCSRHFASVAKAYLQNKEYRVGIEFYRKAIKRYPLRVKYWKNLIKSLYRYQLERLINHSKYATPRAHRHNHP